MSLEDDYELDPSNELGINPAELDVEWFRQAELFMKYARAAATAEKVAKEAHEKTKMVRSELIREANDNPDECLGQGNKATGGNVEAYYRNHKDHIKAKADMIEAEYERDIMQGAKSAIYMKKSALEALVRLSVQGWFASPITPRALDELQERINDANDKSVEAKIAGKREPRTKKMSRKS